MPLFSGPPGFIIGIVTIMVGGLVIAFNMTFGQNIARDAAAPIERSLMARGAIKQCEIGDGGHGPDNTQPWYESIFTVPKSRDETVALLQKVSADNGYSITQGSLTNKNEVADIWLSDNYFDYKTVDVQRGVFGDLVFRLYKDLGCRGKGRLLVDDNNTPFVLHMSNPVVNR